MPNGTLHGQGQGYILEVRYWLPPLHTVHMSQLIGIVSRSFNLYDFKILTHLHGLLMDGLKYFSNLISISQRY